jgi:hypothetical protein
VTTSTTTTAPRIGFSTSELAESLGLDLSPSPMVEIDLRQVERLGQLIVGRADFRAFSAATWDDPLFWNVHDPPELRSQLFALGNAINFRFWRLENDEVIPATGIIDGCEYAGQCTCGAASGVPLIGAMSGSSMQSSCPSFRMTLSRRFSPMTEALIRCPLRRASG